MGLLQLFQYAIQLVILTTLVLTPLMMLTRSLDGVAVAPLGILGLGVPLLYVLGQQALYPDWAWRSMYFPILMIFSSGMAVNNSRAALSALLGRPGEFKRTPKFHLIGKSKHWIRSHYVSVPGGDVFGEIAFGLYTLFSALLAQS